MLTFVGHHQRMGHRHLLETRHVTQTAPQAADRTVARKLWDVDAEMVHLVDAVPEVA